MPGCARRPLYPSAVLTASGTAIAPRKRRRIALVGALLAVALPTAYGCDGGWSGNGVSGEISFLVFGEPEELEAYRSVVEEFRTREANVTVNLIEASDRADLLARLSTSFAGGSPPDLFLLN